MKENKNKYFWETVTKTLIAKCEGTQEFQTQNCNNSDVSKNKLVIVAL